MAVRFQRTDQQWAPLLRGGERRVHELETWPADRAAPPRWRLIEAWTIAAHGPQMAVAGGFRLAFWSEASEHHGPRPDRALAHYERYASARPPGWPAGPLAGVARFLQTKVRRQLAGPSTAWPTTSGASTS
jgi:hypothetical protein